MFAEVIGVQLSAISESARCPEHLCASRTVHRGARPRSAQPFGVHQRRREPSSKGDLERQGCKILDMMHGSVVRMSGLIDNVLDFARGRLGGGFALVAGPGRPRADLATGGQRVAHRGAGPDDRDGLHIARAGQCDPTRFGQMVSNLLANGLTHGAPEGLCGFTRRQMARSWKLGRQRRRADPASDDGAAVSAILRGEARPSQKGLGLGLHIASEIAKAHGGAIEALRHPKRPASRFGCLSCVT